MNRHRLNGERRLYTAAQVRELDACAINQHGIPGFTLMRRAGRAAFEELRRRWPDAGSFTVLCGGGNNGGDGYVIAALARQAGLQVDCRWLSDPGRLSGDAAAAFRLCRESGVEPSSWSDDGQAPAEVVVDALLGTGLDREVQGEYAAAIDWMNSQGSPVLAVDIPSGLNADSGARMGVAVQAAATVSFIGLKRGLFTAAGPDCSRAVIYDSLDVPAAVMDSQHAAVQLMQESDLSALLPSRRRDAHKGDHGHVLCIGGDCGMSGAIRMTAEAALRAGAGLVSVATRESHAPSITQQRPEIMCRGVESDSDLEPMLERASVIVVGPGLGEQDWGRGMLRRALSACLPLVVDADALNLVAEDGLDLPEDSIITPHPGEAARLLGTSSAAVQADRFAALSRLRQTCGVAVLKGAGTLVADGESTKLCPYGNPGMAVSGMGDVLCGVIAALRAQGSSAADAASTGVLVHALAGDRAAANEERGMLAMDLMRPIRHFVNPR